MHTHQIDTATHFPALIIRSIPNDLVKTAAFVFIDQTLHFLASEVVDAQLHITGVLDAVFYGGAGIEGIGIVAFEAVWLRRHHILANGGIHTKPIHQIGK